MTVNVLFTVERLNRQQQLTCTKLDLVLILHSGFKKRSNEEQEDDYSYGDEDTEYGSQTKAGGISVSTETRDYALKDKSHRSGHDGPAPIPARPANVISRELGYFSAAVNEGGRHIASRFKFGGRKLDNSQSSQDKHEAFACRTGSMPVEKTSDESESIVDPTKVIDDDIVDAGERIKDFERR